jgi:hypothetical protein
MILFRTRGVNAQNDFAPALCCAPGQPLGSRVHEIVTMQTMSRTSHAL